MAKAERKGASKGQVGCLPGILRSYVSFQQNDVIPAAQQILNYYELVAWQCFLCLSSPQPPPTTPSHCKCFTLGCRHGLSLESKAQPTLVRVHAVYQVKRIFPPFVGIIVVLLILQVRTLKIRVC